MVSFESDRIAEEVNRFKNLGPSMIPKMQSVVALYAGIVDNPLNEFVAVTIAKSEEYIVRIALQIFFIIGMFQLFLRPETIAENLSHAHKHKFKVRHVKVKNPVLALVL